MKILKIHTLLLVAIFPAIQLQAQTSTKEHLDIALSKPGKPFKFNLGLTMGTIKVVTHTGNNVIVDAEPEAIIDKKESNQNQNTNTNTNINVNNHESKSSNIVASTGRKYLTGQESDNTIILKQVLSGKGLNVLIKVPNATANLKLFIAGKGEITISDVNGKLEITCSSGNLQLKNITGSAVANTVNGNITATFKSIDQKAAMAFSTLVGNIDLTFPVTVAANFKLKSDNGELYTDFKMEADKDHPNAKPNLQAIKSPTSKQAAFRILNKDWVYGNINADGSEIMLTNIDGNMYIRKAR